MTLIGWRPLRLVVRFEGMKLAINLLVKSVQNMVDVLVVFLLFVAIFAVLGVQLFAGKFHTCSVAAAGTKTACIAAGGVWANPSWGNFDTVESSALLLFEMSTLEGWPTAMIAGIDATAVESAPVRDHSLWQGLYFVVWTMVGGMFLVNLFVGVLVDTFATIRRLEDGGNIMSDGQRQWATAMERLMMLRPARYLGRPAGCVRGVAFTLVKLPRFDRFIVAVIFCNTALMAADGYGVDAATVVRLEMAMHACAAVFLLEAALKILAFKFAHYIADPWNAFDFFVVAVSTFEWAIDIYILLGASPEDNQALSRSLRVVRTFRILRTFRVVKASKGLRMLLAMLVLSLPQLLNIGGILAVVMAVYSLLGMQLFGSVRHGETHNANASFCLFSSSMVTLFRCTTGEGWNALMHDLMVAPDPNAPNDSCSYDAGDCGSWVSVPYFLPYMILSSFIVLKMIIAIIIENYLIALKKDTQQLQVEHAEDGRGRIKWPLAAPTCVTSLPSFALFRLRWASARLTMPSARFATSTSSATSTSWISSGTSTPRASRVCTSTSFSPRWCAMPTSRLTSTALSM